MGKKKMPKKTKELSVAIAESSSIAEDTQQQQQIVTPRKRGRPRKIVEKTESEEIKEIKKGEEEEESESKKAKMIGEEEEKKLMKVEGATSSSVAKEIQPQSKSRARRKSKPRKSS